MKLCIIGAGPLYEQATRLADAAGLELTDDPAAADHILPATEDDGVLAKLDVNKALFDPAAWALCSSRLKTDAFLREHGVPVPEYFPGGSEPYLVKPDRGSFGLGIWVTDDYCEVGGAVNAGFVAEEELSGDVWSAVVTGAPGGYTVHPAARLAFDGRRQRIGAYCESAPDADALYKTAGTVAEAIGLRFVLEVEAICHHGTWTVTDLNARLPMLTPDALLQTHGVNLLDALIGTAER